MAVSPLLVFTLATAGFTYCEAIKTEDLVYWKKMDIERWNTFFPSRYIDKEYLTIEAAKQSVPSDIRADLKKIQTFQANELEVAKQVMAGTPAQKCVEGLGNELVDAVDEEQEKYSDCSGDALAKFSRLYSNLAKINSTYQAAYQRAIAGIDTCAKTYPNKDSTNRLNSCIESVNKNYFSTAFKTQSSVNPSPALNYFQESVVICASTAAENVAAKGSEFLDDLVNCAALSKSVDTEQYKEELSQWEGYNDTLASQITAALNINAQQVRTYEDVIIKYYNLQKNALQQYVLESRGFGFYYGKVHSLLDSYYNSVSAAGVNNPGNTDCVNQAYNSLDTASNKAVVEALACDKVIVEDTETRMDEVVSNIESINELIATTGSVAILKCYAQGYVFAPNTVYECSKLASSSFGVEYSDIFRRNAEDVDTLAGYINGFYKDNILPCSEKFLPRTYQAADKTLYDMQRCLYKSSGTTYQVTTPVTRAY